MSRSDPELQQLQQLRLAQGAVASGKFNNNRMLLVRRGYVWITQEGRDDDFWLRAGDAIIVAPGRLVVIEAALDSELSLDHVAQTRASQRLQSCARILSRLFARRITVRQGGR